MRIRSKLTVEERWRAIEKEYTEKGAYAQTELRQKFLESKCQDKVNVREFRSTILSSLPVALANFASAQLAAARMYAPTKTLDPDVLISLIGEEFDRQKMQRSRRYGGGKSKDDDKATDEAMAVNSSSSKWKGKGGAKKLKGECWNCGEKGHFKHKCPKPPKANTAKKEESSKEKASGSANAASECDSESEGAWAAMESGDERVSSDNGSMPGLQSVSDSSSECSEVGGTGLSDDEDWFSEESLVATEPAKPGQYAYMRSELYDSGCTQHISPYREDFTSFTEIPPKSFRAKGANFSQLQLTEVLYSPEVGYTLISIGKLDEKGFSATFSDGKCSICGPDGEQVGEILKSKGLGLATPSLGAYIPKSCPETCQKRLRHRFATRIQLGCRLLLRILCLCESD